MNRKKIKRIWILNHHANGNGDRHDDLANQLVKSGVEVLIIASSYSHAEHEYMNEKECFIEKRDSGLRYAWLHTEPAYKGNGIKRIINMISYLKMIKQYSKDWWTEFGKPDVVIGSSVHPFAWEAAYWISKKTHADYYVEVRDLWPLSLVEIQKINPKHPIVKFFGILEKRAYSRAKMIITTMPYAYKYISTELGFPRDKIKWIPNSIDTEKVDNILNNSGVTLPQELNRYLEENWCAVYAGSLVESECISNILEAAKVLQDRGNHLIKFAIVGEGHLKEQLINEAEKMNLKNVAFFKRVSKAQVAIIVNKAKVCLAAVQNLPLYKYGLSMNKLSDYLYSGSPTIFVCDVENVVNTSGGGITLKSGDMKLFATTIESVYAMTEPERKVIVKKGKQTIREQYDTAVLAKKLLIMLESK